MSKILFTAQDGRHQLYIEVANRFDLPFTLGCDLDHRGTPVYLELPRRYQTARAAKAAATRLLGAGLEWKSPVDVQAVTTHKVAVGATIRAQPTAAEALPTAYERVRGELIEEGYGGLQMSSRLEVRRGLRQLKIDAERLEALHWSLREELNDSDDEE